MLHLSIRPSCRRAVESIQVALEENGDARQMTQSLVELWKCVYRELPRVSVAEVPGYPEYRREWAVSLVAVSQIVDWGLVNREDWEYFRIIEHFAKQARDTLDIVVDASEYDVRKGVYWADL